MVEVESEPIECENDQPQVAEAPEDRNHAEGADTEGRKKRGRTKGTHSTPPWNRTSPTSTSTSTSWASSITTAVEI